MNPLWFVRISRQAHHPASDKRAKLVGVAVILGLLVAGLEWMGWWPAWATSEPRRR